MALNNDFPVPLDAFLRTIKGSEHEVWSKLLRAMHGREKHSELAWMRILNSHKTDAA